MDPINFCRRCGAQVKPDARFCIACGAEVSGSISNPPTDRVITEISLRTTGAYRLWKYGISVVLLCGVGLLALFIWSHQNQIHGKVADAFGDPLADVQVSIKGTPHLSESKGSGSYSMDYSPGYSVIEYRKDGYYPHKIELNLAKNKSNSLDAVILYPKPSETGIFLIDHKSKQLIKLVENTMSRVTLKSGSTLWFDIICKLSDCKNSYKHVPIYSPGLFQFIATNALEKRLHAINRTSAAFYGIPRTGQNGRPTFSSETNSSHKPLDESGAALISAELGTGVYSWVPYKKSTAGYRPLADVNTLTFAIDDAPTLEKTLIDFSLTLEHEGIDERARVASNWEQIDKPLTSDIFNSSQKLFIYKPKISDEAKEGLFYFMRIGVSPKDERTSDRTVYMIPHNSSELAELELSCKQERGRENWRYEYYDESTFIRGERDPEFFSFGDLTEEFRKLMKLLCE